MEFFTEFDGNLTVGQAVRYCDCRSADIDRGNKPLEPVMTGLVQEITDSDHARRFTGEVEEQARSGSPKDAHDRIQFVAPALEIRTGDREVRHIDGRGCGEKSKILLVPEPVRRKQFDRG
jgi:hypothetical protein